MEVGSEINDEHLKVNQFRSVHPIKLMYPIRRICLRFSLNVNTCTWSKPNDGKERQLKPARSPNYSSAEAYVPLCTRESAHLCVCRCASGQRNHDGYIKKKKKYVNRLVRNMGA